MAGFIAGIIVASFVWGIGILVLDVKVEDGKLSVKLREDL
jgi:hypothetical protein